MHRHLLFIEAQTGFTSNYLLDTTHQLQSEQVLTTPLPPAGPVVSIGVGADHADLLEVRHSDGQLWRLRVARDRRVTPLAQAGNPGPGFDLATLYGYDSAGRPQVLLYDRERGQAEMHALNPDGSLERQFVSRGWNRTWTAMITYAPNDGQAAELLLFDASRGLGQIWRIALNGGYTHVRTFNGWSTSWTQLTVLQRRATECDILFYAAGSAMAQRWAIRRDGTISFAQGYGGWRGTWAQIICSDPEALRAQPGPLPVGAGLDAYIRSLGDLQAASFVSRTPMPLETRPIGDIAYQIQREAVRISRSTSELTILTPMADQIWPGAVLQGRSLAANQLSPVPLPRAGGTLVITTDLVRGGSQRSGRVTAASLANVTDLRRALLEQAAPTNSAGAMTLAMSSARTLEHGLVNLGVNVQYQPVTVDLKASLEHEMRSNTVIARVLQVFYTVAFEPDAGPAGFFAPGVDQAQMQAYAGPGNPPVYVSQVSYGRSLVLVVRAQASDTKIKGALDVLVKAAANVHVGIEGEYKSLIETMHISVFESGSTGVGLTTLFAGNGANIADNLLAYIRSGASFSLANPGAAIGFTVRHLGSRNPASVALVTDYTEVVSVSSPEVSGALQIADGWAGGPKPAGVRVALGDQVLVTADGQNWSGVWGSRLYGPDGHPQSWWVFGPISTAGFPLPNETPFALIAGFDRQDWRLVGSSREFTANWSSGSGPKELWFGTNDNDPYNGDDARRFNVSWRVRRASAEQLGLHGVGYR
jgi:hypothetical protein